MRWNLRLAAAHRGIWKASELQAELAEHGLVISAGKMSGKLFDGATTTNPEGHLVGVQLTGSAEELKNWRPAHVETKTGFPREP